MIAETDEENYTSDQQSDWSQVIMSEVSNQTSDAIESANGDDCEVEFVESVTSESSQALCPWWIRQILDWSDESDISSSTTSLKVEKMPSQKDLIQTKNENTNLRATSDLVNVKKSFEDFKQKQTFHTWNQALAASGRKFLKKSKFLDCLTRRYKEFTTERIWEERYEIVQVENTHGHFIKFTYAIKYPNCSSDVEKIKELFDFEFFK